LPLPEAIAIVIMASQKSAPVAVTVILYITSDASIQGILALPCVVGQIAQVFVDQPIAHYLAALVSPCLANLVNLLRSALVYDIPPRFASRGLNALLCGGV
jgi:SBF-like CPA transporter family (DUF4137)